MLRALCKSHLWQNATRQTFVYQRRGLFLPCIGKGKRKEQQHRFLPSLTLFQSWSSDYGSLIAPLLVCAPIVALLEAGETTNETQDSTIETVDSVEEADDGKGWVALYLDEASQRQLRERFDHFAHDNIFAKQLTLQFNPSEAEYATVSDTVGMDNIQIAPVALVTSNNVQVLYCDIVGKLKFNSTATSPAGQNESDNSNGNDDTILAVSENQSVVTFDSRITALDAHPYIVLSTTTDNPDQAEIQATLAQVAAASLLDLARNAEEFSWSGMLPAVEGGGSSTPVTVQRFVHAPLNATVCTNFRWDEKTMSCKPPGECGFCKFMRAGPCGDVFTAWEDCIDRCKKEDSDFVDICGSQTMALKDCVDVNPEYYGVLGGEPEAEH
jgi:hypothetical protein